MSEIGNAALSSLLRLYVISLLPHELSFRFPVSDDADIAYDSGPTNEILQRLLKAFTKKEVSVHVHGAAITTATATATASFCVPF